MPPPDYSWLPDHQLHAALTMAHIDSTIERAGQIHYDYVASEPLSVATTIDGQQAAVVVTHVRPLPAALSRLFADALTQLRAGLEHALYAEVEHALGRRLTYDEGRAIEMPCYADEASFRRWLSDRRRAALTPFQPGANLAERIRRLQPFFGADGSDHPLQALVEHTNHAKHRTPTIAASRLAVVAPDHPNPNLTVADASDLPPLQIGDVLVIGPSHVRVPVSIAPTVAVQRPRSGTWHVLINELDRIEQWVRRVAIPTLITGGTDVAELPPQLDITVGYANDADLRSALNSAGTVPAAVRASRRIMAESLRPGLVETMIAAGVDKDTAQTWVDGLDDDQLIHRGQLLLVANIHGIAPLVVDQWVHEAIDEPPPGGNRQPLADACPFQS